MDLIDRQAAIDALEEGFKDATEGVDKLSPTYGLIKAVTGIYKCLIGKLPSAQPEPCEDAVSRSWLLAEYDRQHQGPPGGARKIIETAPPVTPKQRTGKWIKKHRHYGGFRSYTGFDAMGEQHTVTVDERTEYDDLYCSECGARSADNFLNFCPNCGVKMEGDAE